MEFHHILQRYAMRTVNAVFGTIISLIIVAYLKWEIAVMMAILVPASVLLTENVKRKARKAAEEFRKENGQYNAWLMEILRGFREMKLLAAGENIEKKFVDKNNDLLGAKTQKIKIDFGADRLIVFFIL